MTAKKNTAPKGPETDAKTATEKDVRQNADAPEEPKKDPVQILAAEVKKLRSEVLLERANMENTRKRLERQKREDVKYAAMPLMRELVTVIDHLQMALTYAKEADPLRQGVGMALDEMMKVLQKDGLVTIPAVGEKFDPSKHEAVGTANDATKDDDIVVQETRVGYQFHDRVVRASGVIVNRRPAPAAPQPGEPTPKE